MVWGDDNAVLDEIVHAVGECVVPIFSEDGFEGTGFFVAPGLVLTCSHVLHAEPTTHNWLAFAEGEGEGGRADESGSAGDGTTDEDGTGDRIRILEVLQRRPERGTGSSSSEFSLPDLALLRVDAPGRRCALVDWPSPQPTGRELVAVGVRAGSNRNILDAAFQVPLRLRHKKSGSWGLEATDAEMTIVGGMSGSPVLDTRTGAVVAIIKGNRSNAGVKAVPLSAALDQIDRDNVTKTGSPTPMWAEHDRHHAADEYWPARIDLLTTVRNRPDARALARLFGILADMPVPDHLPYQAVTALVGRLPHQPEAPLRTAAEGIRKLVQSPPEGGATAAILRYLGTLCHGHAASDLCEAWARELAGREGQEFVLIAPAQAPTTEQTQPGVLLVFRPTDSKERRFTVTVWTVDAQGVFRKRWEEPTVFSADHVRKGIGVGDILQQALSDLRSEVGGAGALLVEFVVPETLRDMDPAAWTIYRNGHVVGQRHVVVIRDFRRFDRDGEDREQQRQWWQRAAGMTSVPLSRLECLQLPQARRDSNGFAQTAVVFPGPTGRDTRAHEAFEEYMYQGGAAAVWPLSPCPDHPRRSSRAATRGPCRGDVYAAHITHTLNGVMLQDFAFRLWQIHRSAQGSTGLAILYDDPNRRPPAQEYRSPARSGK
ncbi:MAG: trypsin-like peptidase domain-containing protein [Catenulispora sp.]|nr:trypsin-like peptidase domain-containing protein [Catenulispora sp.]